jgi:nucleotide-binding universal stress UspA family protein
MRTLLVPVDSSECAMRALEYAIALAKRDPEIELHLVHAHEPPVLYGEVAVYMPQDTAEELQRTHSEDILKRAGDLAAAAGVKYRTEVLIGHVPKVIASRAEEVCAEAIVMGTRGMGVVANLVMGSVATKVVHLTRLPVTLVK